MHSNNFHQVSAFYKGKKKKIREEKEERERNKKNNRG
jgi:hypothetical protein